MTTQLVTDLGVNTEFIIEMITPGGAVLYVERRTPLSLETGNVRWTRKFGQVGK
jgi:archaellin